MKISLKKSLAFLLSLTMVFSLMAAPVSALEVDSKDDAAIIITVGDATISQLGETVEVPVTVEFADETAIFDAFGLQFVFNDSAFVMSPSSGRTDPVIKTDDTTLCDKVTGNPTTKQATYADASGYGIDKVYADDLGSNVLFYLKLDAVENYIDGEYTLDVNIIDNQPGNFAYHSQGLDVYFVPGTITMENGISPATLTPVVTAAESQVLTYDPAAAPAVGALSCTYTVAAEGEVSYQWYKNGTAIEGATASTYKPAAPELGTTDTYYVEVTNVYSGSSYVGKSNEITVTYNKATVATAPAAVTDLVYNGSLQSGVTWTAGAGYTMSGTVSAVDAGNYTATATLDYGFTWADGTTDAKTINWSIAPLAVSVSRCTWNYSAALPYTGTEQTVELTAVPEGVKATYTGNTATAVGKYTATVSFEAVSGNYTVTGSVANLSWSIDNADITVTGDKSVSVYNNQIPVSITDADVKGATVDGSAVTITVAEKSDAKGLITVSNNQITATGAGTGEAVVTVTLTAANHNTISVDVTVTVSDKIDVSGQLTFTAKEGPASYDLLNNTTLADYVNALDYSGVTASGESSVTYYLNDKQADLTTPITAAGTYVVKAVYEDDLQNGVCTITFTVAKAKIDVSGASWNYSEPFTYSGTAYTVELTGLPAGVTAAYAGNTGTDAGNYTATATVALAEGWSDTNYEIVGEIASCDWVINKAVVDPLPSAASGLVYTGEELTGVTYNTADGYGIAVVSVVAATNAGTYTAIFQADENHYWPAIEGVDGDEYTLEWSIARAKVDASSVEWSYTEPFTYTGSEFTVEVTGLPAGVTAAYTGNAATNAGEYTATVTLTAVDTVNCEVDGTVAPLSWKIEKASAGDLTDSASLRYSTTLEQSVTAADVEELIGDSNAGITIVDVAVETNEVLTAKCEDGVVKYALMDGLTDAAAGTSVKITISYQADNYTDGTVVLTVEVIDKNDVSDKLTFKDGSGTYTGAAHKHETAKMASGYKGTITYSYSGNMTDAGTYTVTAIYEDDDNYGVATAEYVIKPASISFSGATVTDKAYDGTTAAEVKVTLKGLLGEDVAHTVTAEFANANVGKKSVTYTVALDESVTNYVLTRTTGTASGTITAKEIGLTVAAIADQTYTGSAIKPAVVVSSADTVDGYQLAEGTDYTVAYADNTNAGQAKVTVTAKKGSNYTFTTAEVNFNINAANPEVTADNLSVEYTGEAISADKITGNATFNGKKIKGTWSWVTEPSGVNASEAPYAAVVKFTPDNTSLNAVECAIEVVISKAEVKGAPAYKAISTTGKTLADAELALGTLPEGGIVEWVDDEGNLLDLATVVELDKAYTWRYTPADVENYQVKTGTITPYRSAPAYVPTTYSIAVAEGENGTVSADKRSAEAGDKVTVTVTPAEGYKLGNLLVVDDEGNAIVVTLVSEGVYTFVMPDSKVFVGASFSAKVPPIVFADMDANDWFHDDVYAAYEAGLMNGVGNQMFAPEEKTTRAMMMTILARLAGVDTTGGETWYSVGMAWAVENGISDGTNPEQDITREQVITMLFRFSGAKAVDHDHLGAYADGAEVSDWAKDAMNWAVCVGLIQGDELGRIEPADTATRAEIATMLVRYTRKVMN